MFLDFSSSTKLPRTSLPMCLLIFSSSHYRTSVTSTRLLRGPSLMLPTQDQEKNTQYLWDKGVGDQVLRNAHTGQDYELTIHGKRDIIPQPSLGGGGG